MSQARLVQLLKRFGLEDLSAASRAKLHAAYLRKARHLHPDAGGAKDGTEFIQLKKDYETAQKILADLGSLRMLRSDAASNSDTTAPLHRAASSRSPTEPRAAGPPGAPPVLVWVVGVSCSLIAMLWSLLHENTDHSVKLVNDNAVATVGAMASTRQKASIEECKIERPVSEYYTSRSKKGKESSILEKRPHAKQRGSTYISPVHAAAEDGLAEWLHFAGEKSRVCLCESLDRQQQSPLHYAARAGQYDSCAVLLKFQADPLMRDGKGRTPLDFAKETGKDDLVQMLRQGPPGPLANNQFRKKPSLRSQNKGICG